MSASGVVICVTLMGSFALFFACGIVMSALEKKLASSREH